MTAREADLVEPIVVWPDPSPLHSWWTTVMTLSLIHISEPTRPY